jgi:GntR family transcriptional regulator
VKVIQPLGGGAAIEPQLDTIGVLVYPYTNAVTQVRIELNPSLGVPIYRQIMDGIRDLIASGVLQPGDQLPSIREIASELRINPASAVKAYGELRHAGLIQVNTGRGTFVARRPSIVNETREELLHRDLESVVARAKARGSTEEQILAAVRRALRKRRRAR